MKKITLLGLLVCFAFMLTSCGSEDDIPGKDKLTYKEMLNDRIADFYEYGFSSLTGFDFPPEIIEFYNNKILKLDDDNYIRTDEKNIYIYGDKAYDYYLHDFIFKAYKIPLFLNYKNYRSVADIKDHKLWINAFDYNTKKLIKEFESTDNFPETLSFEQGYGKSPVTVNSVKIYVCEVKDTYYTLLGYDDDNLDSFYFNVLAFAKNNSFKIVPGRTMGTENWGDFGILLENWDESHYILSLFDFEGNHYGPYTVAMDFLNKNQIIPLDFESVFYCNGCYFNYCTLNDFSLGWYVVIPALQHVKSDAEIIYTMTGNKDNIVSVKADVFNHNGTREIINFSVNIETREVL